MINKLHEIVRFDLTQAFLKALLVLGLLSGVLCILHVALSLLFWSHFVFGGLFGAAVAWGTYFNYTYGSPQVGPFGETSGGGW